MSFNFYLGYGPSVFSVLNGTVEFDSTSWLIFNDDEMKSFTSHQISLYFLFFSFTYLARVFGYFILLMQIRPLLDIQRLRGAHRIYFSSNIYSMKKS